MEKLQAFKRSVSTINGWLQVLQVRPVFPEPLCFIFCLAPISLWPQTEPRSLALPLVSLALPQYLAPVTSLILFQIHALWLWNVVHVFSAFPPLFCSWLDFAPSSQCQYLAQVHFAMLPIQELFSKPKQIRLYKLVQEPDITGTLIAARNYG